MHYELCIKKLCIVHYELCIKKLCIKKLCIMHYELCINSLTHPFRPCQCGLPVDSHFIGGLHKVVAGEVTAQGGKQGVTVGVGAAAHLGRGQEREDVRGVPV